MAKKKMKASAASKAEQNADQLLSKTDQFLDKHLKELIIGASVVVVLVLAILGVRHFYLIPKEANAERSIYVAERYLGEKQWDAALNGDSIGSIGFLEVIDDFGSTKSGNLAKAYAGICYYHLADYDNAVKYLKQYKQKEQLLGSTITGLIGDAYANLGQVDNAAKQFVKAAAEANSESFSPLYLKKAAVAYESLGRNEDALKMLTQIEEKYPNSAEGRTVEKDILRAKELIKK